MKKLLIVLAVLAAVMIAVAACQPATVSIPNRSMQERVSVLCQGGGACVDGWNGSIVSLYSDEGSTIGFKADGDGRVKVNATAVGTATPVVMIVQGGSGRAVEVRNAGGTPVAGINADGSAVFAGSITSSGAVNGGGVLGSSFAVAPTTVATNTPVFYVNSASGNTANLMEARVANTPVWQMDASGNINRTGSMTGSNYVKISAPTAIASATPAFVVDTAGVSNVIDARKNATPVFQVNGAGNTTIAGTLALTGASNFTGNIIGAGTIDIAGTTNLRGAVTAASETITGTLTVGTFLNTAPTSALPVVASTPIAPTRTFQILSSAGAVDPGGIGNGTTAGQILILEQSSNQTITLTEAGTLHLGAATRALGQYDTIILMWDGAAWVELAFTDN